MPVSNIHTCPNCNRTVQFRHIATTLIACECGKVVNRKDGDVVLAKDYPVISQSQDLIRPGSSGTWLGKKFLVLGRFRLWFDESVYNYWTIELADGNTAYLAEGYGNYALLEPAAIEPGIHSQVRKSAIGDHTSLIKNQDFVLQKKLAVLKWEVEGEVLMHDCDAIFTIYEYASALPMQLTIFEWMPALLRPHIVTNSNFSELNLQNLKQKTVTGFKFTCSNCNNIVHVKTFPQSQSAGCNCGKRYVFSGGTFKKIDSKKESSNGPDITLGTSGMLRGVNYECVGYTLKEERNAYHSQWKEYTLYNELEGFAFLSEYEGNWIYARQKGNTPVLPKIAAKSFDFGGEPFRLFNRYEYSILLARGEFPYNIFDAGQTTVWEYISPPEMWILEYNRKEGINWFLGEHIARKEVAAAFSPNINLPWKNGIGAVEPTAYVNPLRLLGVTISAIILVVILFAIIAASKENRIVHEGTYAFNDSVNSISVVSSKFHLNKARSNIELSVFAPVDNDWFELAATLVDTKTGTEYNIEKGVEYYHGYSDGETWSEGSREEKAYLTYLPASDYILQLQGNRSSTGLTKLNTFSVVVTYDVPGDRNLLWCFLLLLIWPIVQYLRTNYNEKRRWSNSPYSTYNNES